MEERRRGRTTDRTPVATMTIILIVSLASRFWQSGVFGGGGRAQARLAAL